MKNILLILVILSLFLPSDFTQTVKSDVFTRARNEGMVAVQILRYPEDTSVVMDSETIVPEELCKCLGKKYILAGDGTKLKCKCGDNCKCGKTTTSDITVSKQWYYFYTDGCTPCANWEASEGSKLRANGWGVDSSEKSYIKKINASLSPEVYNDLTADENGVVHGVPAFVLMENGKKVKVLYGSQSHKTLTDLFYGRTK